MHASPLSQTMAADKDPLADPDLHQPATWPDVHVSRGPAETSDLPGLPESNETDENDDQGDDDLGDLDDLLNADIEQLSRTDVVVPGFSEEVSTVSREESTVGRSAASVYVITGEMIRRSGYRSIAESLRLAPGVQVAKMDSNKWSISIRGFNGQFSNKLLVQIDGRSVYTPLFAGVFWDVQDVLIADIDRIEVIRGPGASLWGANAVNGIINVITKNANDTRGLFAQGGWGNERKFASARVGGQKGNMSWRTYGKWFDRNGGFSPSGDFNDDWEVGRAGFRTDWKPTSRDTVTFQGDYYDGNAGETLDVISPTPPFETSTPSKTKLGGGNALLRWSRKIDDQTDWTFQSYYDRTERYISGWGFGEDRDTVDLDFQIRFPWRQNHSVIVGAGYRNTRDKIQNSPFQLQVLPSSRSLDTFNVYLQDKITLQDDLLYLTLGSKFSANDFTGFEIQPTARLLYTPSKRRTVWASVSRAVRTPSRFEDDLRLMQDPFPGPVFPLIRGNRNVISEQLLALELGMRSAPIDEFFWDLSLFYHRYDDLIGINGDGVPGVDPISGEFVIPVPFTNGTTANGYGFELATTAILHEHWTLRTGYSYLKVNLAADPSIVDTLQGAEGDPRNQFFFNSSWDVGRNCEVDLIGRYNDMLRFNNTPSYFELDARLGWRINDGVDFSLAGRNLLDKSHPEFGRDSEVRRELYGVFTWRY